MKYTLLTAEEMAEIKNNLILQSERNHYIQSLGKTIMNDQIAIEADEDIKKDLQNKVAHVEKIIAKEESTVATLNK